MAADSDRLDIAELGRTLRREWKPGLATAAIVMLVAVIVLLFAPRRFEGSASLVLRTSGDAGGSLLSRLGGGVGELAMGGLGGAMRSPLETELQVLRSRALADQVIDSLRLQVLVKEPRGRAPFQLVELVRAEAPFRKLRVDAVREGQGYRLSWDGGSTLADSRREARLPVGTVRLADGALPERFTFDLLDREDAVTWFLKRRSVEKAGGEVGQITFLAPDSLTAARVPNVLVDVYLARRLTTDRGVNARRVEFLTEQLGGISTSLADAESRLRAQQEASGVLDPETYGKVQLEQLATVRSRIGETDVEIGAIEQLLAQAGAGTIRARQLAAYPAFLRSPGINELLSQLSTLETERTRLLERRAPEDPEIVALSASIQDLEAQLAPLARSYAASLRRQREELNGQLAVGQRILGVLPGAAQSAGRLTREVLQLSQVHTAVQAQLVEARLAAIGEGGDVRRLDVATPPKKPEFPRPLLTLGAGAIAAAVLGLLMAFLAGVFGRRIREPRDVERATGLSAVHFDPAVPLILGGRDAGRTVVLVPVGDAVDTEPVAARLAATATARHGRASIMDGPQREDIEKLEQEDGSVIVRLSSLSDDRTAALLGGSRPVVLVGRAGHLDRAQLQSAVRTLQRLDVPLAGVVLQAPENGKGRRLPS